MWGGRRRRRRERRGRRITPPLFRSLVSTVDGERVRVVRVHGGRTLVHRLAALGLVPGSVVTVTRSRGPAILRIGGARVVVGRNAAMAVEVEEGDR